MKKLITILITMVLLIGQGRLEAQSGGMFAVGDTEPGIKVTTTVERAEEGNQQAAGKKSLWQRILSALAKILLPSNAEASTLADNPEKLQKLLEEVNTTVTEADAQKAKEITKKSIESEPALVKHTAPGSGISVGSSQFKGWFDEAAKLSSNWKFPQITNKFGKVVSKEDYLRAIIWIESKGVHKQANGKIIKSHAGATGFMQLMPNTAKGLKVDPNDAAANLKGGSKYLGEIFGMGQVGKKDGVEKLIMGACAYNLGPFSKSMAKCWEEVKVSNLPVETKSYGIKLKMATGLALTADEKKLAAQWFVPKHQTVDDYTKEFYAHAQGIAR